MRLRFITWNVDGKARSEAKIASKLDLLRRTVDGADLVVAALQEVGDEHFDALLRSRDFDFALTSLLLRPPRDYDGGNRRLGCALAVRGPLMPRETLLVPDCPLPERSLAVRLALGPRELWACSFHALTGSGFGHAKPVMFRALTRWLEARWLPCVFGIDRNTPKVDHPELSKCEWWWPGEEQEPLMFGEAAPHECEDALRKHLAAHPLRLEALRQAHPEGPLATTHERGKDRVPSRYDAIYVSPSWRVLKIEHLLDAGVAAGSDHALVVAELELAGAD